jgi:Na+/H+-dicarboxylate symporter
MKKIELHWQILIAFILAILFGLFLHEYVNYVRWLGELFLRALKMVIVPLVLTSMIAGVSNLGESKSLGRIGFKAFAFFISTGIIAIITGLIFVNIIKPGLNADLGLRMEVPELAASKYGIKEIILRIIPTNIFEAFVNADMIAIIFFAILFGLFTLKVEAKYRDTINTFFNSAFEVMMKLTSFIILFAPIGIFGIVAGVVADQSADKSKLLQMFGHLGIYMITVLLSLGFHFFLTLPLILKLVGGINPLNHFRAMALPLLTAFSTSSSSATLPVTINAVEKNAGVSNKISSFVLPLGATVNMNGTALYECVAALFISQAYGIELTFLQQMIVVLTALLASIGAAGIPMAGLVMMSIVLTAVGLPLEGIGLILAVDRILDMSRTALNVFGDTCGAVLIAKLEGEKLNI